jgi:hypothetical protein
MIDHRRILDRADALALSGVDVGPGTRWFFARAAVTMKTNPSEGRREYEAFLRDQYDLRAIEALKDRHLVTTKVGYDLAGVLFRVAGLSSQNLNDLWMGAEISAFDIDSHEQELLDRESARYANNSANTAKDALRTFLKERSVHYTNDEFNTLFETMRDNIARGSQPSA